MAGVSAPLVLVATYCALVVVRASGALEAHLGRPVQRAAAVVARHVAVRRQVVPTHDVGLHGFARTGSRACAGRPVRVHDRRLQQERLRPKAGSIRERLRISTDAISAHVRSRASYSHDRRPPS